MRHLLVLGIALVFVAGLAGRAPTPSDERPAAPSDTETVEVAEPEIAVFPERVLQGEPALVAVAGLGTTTLESLSFNGKPLRVFSHNGKPTALIGFDLAMPSGTYSVVATLADGSVLERELAVGKRVIAQAPLGIPDNLGGNTAEGERNVITSLARENAILASIATADEKLWDGAFSLPLSEPIVVTDTYGYTRLTGASTISHKGTDYRASVGTPVFAMNDGIVRVADEFTIYGKTVIIDHGLGLQTLYMHLSELAVEEGDPVEKGMLIAKSGKTGYSEFPHLHVSVKIDGISIDPERFVALFR